MDLASWEPNERFRHGWIQQLIISLHLSALLGFILRLFPSGSKMAIGHLRPTLLSQLAVTEKEGTSQ